MLDLMLTPIMAFLTLIIGFLPDADPAVTAYLTSSLTTVKGLLANVNTFIDIPALIVVIKFTIAIEVAHLGLNVGEWILNNVSLGLYKKRK